MYINNAIFKTHQMYTTHVKLLAHTSFAHVHVVTLINVLLM